MDALQSVACPYCSGPSPLRLRARDRNRRVSSEIFDYHECPSCGLLFLRNVPTRLKDYYPPDYFGVPPTLEELARAARPERYKLDLVQRFKSGGSLIEIGPGGGAFAYLAKAAGFDVTVIDMAPQVCVFLRETVGVAAVESADTLTTLQGMPEADVIALWQVIEHLARPWELIRIAAERLKPGGVLILAAPSPRSLQRWVLGSRWVHLDAPRHLALPPAEFLERVAAAEGLETVLVTTRDPGSIGWNRFGWRFFAANLFSGPLLSRAAQVAGILFSWVVAPWEEREGLGTAYTLVLRKRAA